MQNDFRVVATSSSLQGEHATKPGDSAIEFPTHSKHTPPFPAFPMAHREHIYDLLIDVLPDGQDAGNIDVPLQNEPAGHSL
jgi:hypothetical protein